MGKVIHTDTPAKKREKILRLLANLLNLDNISDGNTEDFRDKVSFIWLSLTEINKTIEETVGPWEKREYWIKADKFRADWIWVNELRTRILDKIGKEAWEKLPEDIKFLEEKLSFVEPVRKISKQEYWQGAYQIIQKYLIE